MDRVELYANTNREKPGFFDMIVMNGKLYYYVQKYEIYFECRPGYLTSEQSERGYQKVTMATQTKRKIIEHFLHF